MCSCSPSEHKGHPEGNCKCTITYIISNVNLSEKI